MRFRFCLSAAAVAALIAFAPASGLAAPEGGAHGESHGEPGAHGGSHGGGHEDSPLNLFSFDYGPGKHYANPPLGFAILNFAILIGLLVKFGGPKIRQSLVARHDNIKTALEEGARLRKEAQDKLEEYKQRIAHVDAEVEQLVGEIRAQAEEEKARILAEAEKQAAAMKKDAEDRINAEIARARRTLEAEVVTAAVAATEKLLQDNAQATDQTKLVDTFISNLGAAQASASGKN